MKISLNPFKPLDLSKAFELYEISLHDVIDEAFGWDKVFQQKRFFEKYSLDWFYWIEFEGNVSGYICYSCGATDLHVSLVIIEKQFQGKGIGKKVMNAMGDLAVEKRLKVSLSSFKNNQSAVTFYKKLGFRIIKEDDYFFDFESDSIK